MPLARHDTATDSIAYDIFVVSTHMPLARHDDEIKAAVSYWKVSTHMPLARHDPAKNKKGFIF